MSTRRDISAYDVAAAVFLFFLFFFAIPLLYRLAYEYGELPLPREGIDGFLINNFLIYLSVLAVCAAIVLRKRSDYLYFKAPEIAPWLVLSVAFMIALMAVEFGGKKLIFGKVAATEDRQILDFIFIDGKPHLYSVIFVVILGPIVEEFLDRGIIFSFLRSHMPFFAAALTGSALFAASHVRLFSAELPIAIAVAGLSLRILSGFAACYLLEKSGSLWPPVLFHMLKNGAAVAFAARAFAAGS